MTVYFLIDWLTCNGDTEEEGHEMFRSLDQAKTSAQTRLDEALIRAGKSAVRVEWLDTEQCSAPANAEEWDVDDPIDYFQIIGANGDPFDPRFEPYFLQQGR